MATQATEATFEAMYATHVRDVLAYCLRRTPHAEAHDATAETFAVAWRRRTELPPPPETRPWLFGVAANVLKNQGRSSRRAHNLAGKIGSQAAEFQPGPEAQLVRRAEYDEVHKAIDSLKPKYRDVLKLVEWEELSRETVADMLSVSRATIDQRIHRAYQQLERRLKHLSTASSHEEGGAHAQQQLRELVKASNPVSAPERLLPQDQDVRTLFQQAMHRAGNPQQSADLLEQPVERRRDMQTQDKPIQVAPTPEPPERRRWLIPALAGGVAVVVALVAVALLGGGDEGVSQDVTDTPVPTTILEPATLTPLEVGDALNQATRDGDWEAARLLYADDATYNEAGDEPKSMSRLATGDNFNFQFDWDGDGTFSIFDREAGYLMNEYVAGVEQRYSCTQTDSTTVVCDIDSLGYPFYNPPVQHSNTYTVVEGRITHLTNHVSSGSGIGGARGVKIEYQDWVRANRPELNLDDALFAFLGTPLVVPETVVTHRQLIAEWKAQR